MPTIAVVDGVRVMIYFRDHLPPHVRAKFGEHEAQISIVTGAVLNASLPRGAIAAWLDVNRDEVAYIWSEIRAGRYEGPISE